MATAKKDVFQPDEVRLAACAKAFAHPARIAILKVLAECTTCICGELVDELPLAQSTVSQHLKALKAAGFVQGTIDGPRSCYCIDWAELERFHKAFETLIEHLSQARSCC